MLLLVINTNEKYINLQHLKETSLGDFTAAVKVI